MAAGVGNLLIIRALERKYYSAVLILLVWPHYLAAFHEQRVARHWARIMANLLGLFICKPLAVFQRGISPRSSLSKANIGMHVIDFSKPPMESVVS